MLYILNLHNSVICKLYLSNAGKRRKNKLEMKEEGRKGGKEERGAWREGRKENEITQSCTIIKKKIT